MPLADDFERNTVGKVPLCLDVISVTEQSSRSFQDGVDTVNR